MRLNSATFASSVPEPRHQVVNAMMDLEMTAHLPERVPALPHGRKHCRFLAATRKSPCFINIIFELLYTLPSASRSLRKFPVASFLLPTTCAGRQVDLPLRGRLMTLPTKATAKPTGDWALLEGFSSANSCDRSRRNAREPCLQDSGSDRASRVADHTVLQSPL